MKYRIKRRLVCGLLHPPSLKRHYSAELCPSVSDNFPKYYCEILHYCGSWKDVITGGFIHNLTKHFHKNECTCVCQYISVSLLQIVSGGARYLAEYVVVAANCTNDVCEPLNDPLAVSTENTSLVLPKNNTFY